MSDFKIFAVEPRQRNGERNWYTIPFEKVSRPMVIKKLPLPNTYVTNLSEEFHEEFLERLQPYLIKGDIIHYSEGVSHHKFYPLDTTYKGVDFTFRDENIFSSFNEILYVADEGVILEEGYVSAMVDCHLKTLIMEMAKYRPGNVAISFAPPDLVDATQYGKKSLYAFLMFEPRHARLETETSFYVESINV